MDADRTRIPLSNRRQTPTKLLRGQFTPRRVSLFKPVNIGLMAELAADKFGRSVPIYLDRPFEWDAQTRVEFDYIEYAELVRKLSAALKNAGVKKRDRVAIVKSPGYDVQAFAWAAARIGAIPAPLSPGLDPKVINVLLERLQPRVLVTDPAVAKYIQLDPAKLPSCAVIGIGAVDGATPLDELWDCQIIPEPDVVGDREPMLITHTSSTTGVSKLCEASAATITFSALRESIFPFGHSGGELVASAVSHTHLAAAAQQLALFSRGTPVLGIGRPDDDTVLELFERYRPTIVITHPNEFMRWERLVDHQSHPFASIRIFFSTFDAMHPRTIRRLLNASERRWPIWVNCYGSTETGALTVAPITRNAANKSLASSARSIGWELPGARVRIVDPKTGMPVESGAAGMIQAKSSAQSLSFIGTPEKYAERRHGNWLDTGDWGRRGRWHRIEILDRIADRIDGVSSCLEIEDRLLDLIPDAEEIVVIVGNSGKPIPVISMTEGTEFDEIKWHAAGPVTSGLGQPVLVPSGSLPRTATVKTKRFLLSEMARNDSFDNPGSLDGDILLRDGA
jgi:acyl-coenzyme A synthetase/AMP-(fatty) acid ligase